MWRWFVSLDRVLRGESTQLAELQSGRIQVPIFGVTAVGVLLAATYGVCMGAFALLRPEGPEWRQVAASAAKTPLLFFVTLAITFPSLYVFNALFGARLSLSNLFRLLIAAIAVNVAVLASLGPIVAFFAISSTSYSFMVLLNVLVFAVSGLLGLSFLLQTLHRLTLAARHDSRNPALASSSASPAPGLRPGESADPLPGPLARLHEPVYAWRSRAIFACWTVLYGLVGAQTGWLLRPFVGDPELPFAWLRPRESNFYEALAVTWRALLGSGG